MLHVIFVYKMLVENESAALKLLFQIITDMKPHEGGYTLLQRLKDGFRLLLQLHQFYTSKSLQVLRIIIAYEKKVV